MGNHLNSFEKRYLLSELVIDYLPKILSENDVELVKFGSETISTSSSALTDFLMTLDSRKNHSAMLVKFAPDFIMLDKKRNEIFFIEVKASLTPLCLETNRKQMKKIEGCTPDITEIADMDRDAWNAYKNLYPRTIIVDACVYNPTVLACQFVQRIECLRCFKDYRTPYDCTSCPVKQRKTFDAVRNEKSEGSRTPHMNFSLKNFEVFESFFKKFGVDVNLPLLKELIEKIKEYPINFPSIIYPETKNQIIEELKLKGCYWAK